MTLDLPPLEPWRVFIVLAGPFVGTLAATWAVAWPRLPRPLFGGSTCARCGTPVPLWRQIPLVSWAVSRGGRGCCEGRIPRVYPLGEAAGLVVGLASGLLATNAVEATLRFLLGITLIYASLVDLRRYVIPVEAIAVVAVLGMAERLLRGDWPGLWEGLVAAVATFAAFEALRRGFALAREDVGLGLGDGLVAGALGLWVGAKMAIVVAVAAGMTLLVRGINRRRAIGPFGWALAAAGFALAVRSAVGRDWPS